MTRVLSDRKTYLLGARYTRLLDLMLVCVRKVRVI